MGKSKADAESKKAVSKKAAAKKTRAKKAPAKTNKTNGKTPVKKFTKQTEKIYFEEFRGVLLKSFSALDIRPEGQMTTIMQVMYTALATCFPEKFHDIVFHQAGDTPKVYLNTLSRKDILNPYGVDASKVKRNPIGSWPGYSYAPPKPAKETPRLPEKGESDKAVRSVPSGSYDHLNR